MKERMSYAKAGVDIKKEAEAISTLIRRIRYAREGFGAPIELKNHFTGIIDFGDFAISLCTDGVGTKVLIANEMKKWDTVGIDCIAMNVNDTICIGAEPLAFVDYLVMERPDPAITREIGIGLERGARLANISIIGGETASLPDLIKGFDLAGSCLGYVRKERMITGEDVEAGDVIIGLMSSGIHSNGLTLARKVIEKEGLSYQERLPYSKRSIGSELLEPTKIYVKDVLRLIDKIKVKGLAHITGGGIKNISRLNDGVGYLISEPFKPHNIFRFIQELGNIEDKEMYQTFNMGMGFCIIVEKEDAESALEILRNENAKVVGEVVDGKGVSIPELGVRV